MYSALHCKSCLYTNHINLIYFQMTRLPHISIILLLYFGTSLPSSTSSSDVSLKLEDPKISSLRQSVTQNMKKMSNKNSRSKQQVWFNILFYMNRYWKKLSNVEIKLFELCILNDIVTYCNYQIYPNYAIINVSFASFYLSTGKMHFSINVEEHEKEEKETGNRR